MSSLRSVFHKTPDHDIYESDLPGPSDHDPKVQYFRAVTVRNYELGLNRQRHQ